MEVGSYIYFGDDLFHKFNVVINDDKTWFQSKFEFKIFNSLRTFCNSRIDKLYLGWSYAIFQIGSKFYITGFPSLENEVTEILKDEDSRDLNMVCGANKFYVHTSNGKLLCYSTHSMQPIIYNLVNQKLSIKKIATGDFYTIALDKDGFVYLLNLNNEFTCTCLSFPCQIAEVCCGKEHGIFLSVSGQVFSFGNGSRGQLGHGTIENQTKPALLEALDGVQMKAIACGGWHSAAISYAGDLYIWGWNESGQLGFPCAELHGNSLPLSDIETICCLPKIVEFPDEVQIISVSCGTRHTAVLTEDHKIWTWGCNEYGQLGHDASKLCDKPYKIPFDDKFIPKIIQCAFWSTLIWGTITS